jgi:hypothetical protein
MVQKPCYNTNEHFDKPNSPGHSDHTHKQKPDLVRCALRLFAFGYVSWVWEMISRGKEAEGRGFTEQRRAFGV